MRNRLITVLLSIYLFFVPFGPLVVIFGYNIKNILLTRIDIFCAIVAAILFTFNFKLNKLFSDTKIYIIAIFISFIISCIFSINISGSFSALVAILFNIFLLNIFLIHFKGEYNYLSKVLLLGFIVSGIFVLYAFLTNSTDHYTQGRFYLVLDGLSTEELVDPNIQASGMVLAFLANYNYFNFKGLKKIIISLFSLVLIISNLIIFNSRSAFLGLIVGGFFILVNKSSKLNMIIYLLSLITILYFSYFLLTSFIDLSLVNLFEKFSVSGDDSRLELINDTIKFYSADLFRILFGLGLDQTNPHNEILKLVFSLGVIGFVLVFFCMIFIIRIVLKNLIINRFRFYYFCLFIMTISMFYEHKKVFWISIILAIL